MGVGCIQGVRLGRVFVMDDVSNRVYSGSLYILNPIDPFLFLANKKISCAIQAFPTISPDVNFWIQTNQMKTCPQNKLAFAVIKSNSKNALILEFVLCFSFSTFPSPVPQSFAFKIP